MWLFLDTLIGPPVIYSVWAAIRFFKAAKARAWREAKASVMSAVFKEGASYCHQAEVFYKYYVDGVSYADVHRELFLKHDSAKRYVKQFSPGTELNILLKPGDPSVSFPCI